jgi:DNA-binding NarL/FixJ family response regulator
VKYIAIYDNQGNIKDLSDREEFVKQLNCEIDLFLFSNKLPKIEQEIINYKMMGYNNKEISALLHVNPKTITRKIKIIKSKISVFFKS